MKQYNSLIQLEQLEVLGFHQSYQILVAMFVAMIACYFILKLIMIACVRKRYTTFLTYFVLSLLILSTMLLLAIFYDNFELVMISLQATTCFGVALILYKMYERIKYFIRRKIKSSNKRYI